MNIRRYYALPEAEKGANAVHLLAVELLSGLIEVQPGSATIGDGEPTEFVSDPDLRPQIQRIEDPARFLAWYSADPSQRNPADNEVQQLVSALLYYLWLQRRGLL